MSLVKCGMEKWPPERMHVKNKNGKTEKGHVSEGEPAHDGER